MTVPRKKYILVLLASTALLAVLLAVTLLLSGGVGSDRVAAGEHPLRISEYMSSNSVYPNGDGVVCDWIEIENTSDRDFNISGYRLSDDFTRARYAFPVGTVIPAGERLVVWCSPDHSGGLYAPFSLKKQGGETILLMNSANTVLDRTETLHARKNCSFIRLPDGSFTVSAEPTPGFANSDEGRSAYMAAVGGAASPLRLSEIMASASVYTGPDGQPWDWIEVENNSDQSLDISGMGLSDKEGEVRYTFPAGTVLAPGGFAVVWCSGDADMGGAFASFKLNKLGGETVILSDTEGHPVERVTLPYLAEDTSYARRSGGWTATLQATPGYTNDEAGYDLWLDERGLGNLEVRLSEIVAKNSSGITDADGDHSDWIELYNAGDAAVDLNGWYITDDPEKPLRWQFPSVTVGPGEYLVIFASGKDRRGAELHTDFALSAGETVILTTPLGVAVDSVELPLLAADRSLARDEGGNWAERTVPTPGR